jgi:hypothetical protein
MLCHRMDIRNNIQYNDEVLYNIVRHIQENSRRKIAKINILKVIKVLIKKGFILEPFEPGELVINPVYYARGTKKDREELILKILKVMEVDPIKRAQLEGPMRTMYSVF